MGKDPSGCTTHYLTRVKKALNTVNNQTVAIKILDREKIMKESLIQNVQKEIEILKIVDHPNIVKLQEILASKTKIFLVLEFVEGGELDGLLSNNSAIIIRGEST